MLCLSCPVCLSCLVCDVGVLWPNGWMDQDETWHAGRPRPWPHCVRWGPSSPVCSRSPHPQFSAHIGCGQMAAYRYIYRYSLTVKIKMDQDATWYGGSLGPGDIVLDGTQPPSLPKRGGAPNFRPMSIVAKRLRGSRCHLVWR